MIGLMVCSFAHIGAALAIKVEEACLHISMAAAWQATMPPYADHRIRQDAYHAPSPVGTLYVKFTADAVTELLLLSFQGERRFLTQSVRQREHLCSAGCVP
ncbi:MAG TPA: type II toxin-antitoxin system MqsR family toxin [Methylocystis sp.]|nr:type II toxin-antitoxin system MqsR family toxin [Methylocystis sp.]